MVWVFDSEECPSTFGEGIPEGVGQSDGTGEFFVGALRVDRSYCVYAHYDLDMDAEMDEGDLLVEADSLVAINADVPAVSGLEIYLVAEDEPGKIAGSVVDSAHVVVRPAGVQALDGGPSDDSPSDAGGGGREVLEERSAIPEGTEGALSSTDQRPGEAAGATGLDSRSIAPGDAAADSTGGAFDSTAIHSDTSAVILDPALVKAAKAESVYLAAPVIVVALDEADSANFVQGSVDRGGTFTLSKVKPGAYRLEVFRDLDGDRGATLGFEPVAVVERLIVRAGRTTEVGELVLRWPVSMEKEALRERILEGKRVE
jgi:hypothetical protein